MVKLLNGVKDIITISIPKHRVYESPKRRNGYDNQIISTDNLGYSTLDGEFAGYSMDALEGEIYLKYVMDAIDLEVVFSGLDGFYSFSGVLSRICQILKQDGIYHIRSINREDFPTEILKVYKWYWVNYIKINNVANPDYHTYKVSYVEDEAQYSTILYSEEYDESYVSNSLGVRPVVYLPLPDEISRNEVLDLVNESFVTWE